MNEINQRWREAKGSTLYKITISDPFSTPQPVLRLLFDKEAGSAGGKTW